MPAFAQDTAIAEPVIVLPQAEPAPAVPVTTRTVPAPAPAIVLPETAPPVLAEVAPDVAAVQPRATSRAQATRQASATPVVDPARTAPIAVAAPAPVDTLVSTASIEPAAAPVVALVSRLSADDATNEALIAGVLGALGLVAVGGVAIAATRRRRRSDNASENHQTVEQPAVEEAVVRDPLAARNSAQAVAPPVVPADNFAATKTAPAVASRAASTSVMAAPNGDPIALPAALPQTFEERDALLKELVAAEPDRANPFTSVRARARRAKLIIQSLGQDFQGRKPRIDLSEYSNRWPALRGWQPAAA